MPTFDSTPTLDAKGTTLGYPIDSAEAEDGIRFDAPNDMVDIDPPRRFPSDPVVRKIAPDTWTDPLFQPWLIWYAKNQNCDEAITPMETGSAPLMTIAADSSQNES